MLHLIESFKRICESYDHVVLDTSVWGRRDVNYGIDYESLFGFIPSKLSFREELPFLNEFILSIKEYENVRTVKGVVREIEKGLRRMKSRRGRDYRSANTGIKNILKTRIIEHLFGEEEISDLNTLHEKLEFLKKKYGLSDTDLGIVLNSVELAKSRGDTAVVSNDKEILETVDLIRSSKIKLPVSLKYRLDPYTSIERDHFYLYQTKATEKMAVG